MFNTHIDDYAHQAAAFIQQKHPEFSPKVGIVLGSGLGALADQLSDTVIIPYAELEGFPELSVHGHGGNLILGRLQGVDVVCLQGRSHSYENFDYAPVRTYVRTLKLLGCDIFIATNASGSLREDVPPGSLMLITDHINLQPGNPLVGPNDERFGPRFYPVDNAYDAGLREQFLTIARENHISLHQGVYVSVLGPNYETAAEIKAFRIWGADAVGMSTVPEVLVANHCGMKVAVIATLTNYATGLASSSHSHEAVVHTAEQAAEQLSALVVKFIEAQGKEA